MRRLLFAPICAWFLSGCASDPMFVKLPPPEGMPHEASAPRYAPVPPSSHELSIRELQTQLGLNRDPQDLGFAHRDFDGCRMSFKDANGSCGRRFLSVVHFRLVCRDTEGTTSRTPSSLTPLGMKAMQWRLAGSRGQIQTDSQGYGQVQVVSASPAKTERFILIIGTKTLGLEAGEVSQIVLPGNWCPRLAMN